MWKCCPPWQPWWVTVSLMPLLRSSNFLFFCCFIFLTYVSLEDLNSPMKNWGKLCKKACLHKCDLHAINNLIFSPPAGWWFSAGTFSVPNPLSDAWAYVQLIVLNSSCPHSTTHKCFEHTDISTKVDPCIYKYTLGMLNTCQWNTCMMRSDLITQ